MQCSFAADGTVKLDTQMMDDWLAQWSDARMYYVFLDLAERRDFEGAKLGTAECDRNVGAWISAWVHHLGTKGIPPERLGLLIYDEPHEKSDIEPFLAWAKAIRAAEPKVLIWEDPVYNDPTKTPAALLESCNILCPNRPMWLAHGESFARFYREQQARAAR